MRCSRLIRTSSIRVERCSFCFETTRSGYSNSRISAAPIIAALFILGTGAVLAVVDPAEVNLFSPVVQAISVAARPLVLAAYLASALFALLLISPVAQASVNFAVNSRLPMVAGWDHSLPAWFVRLHPRGRTPVNSTLFVAALTLAVALGGIAGPGGKKVFSCSRLRQKSSMASRISRCSRFRFWAMPPLPFACAWPLLPVFA